MNHLTCRFCKTPLQQPFLDLGMSPLSNAYVKPEHLYEMEPFFPLTVFVCPNCWLTQLPAYSTPENIFSDYAYFSSYSASWLKHAENYVNHIQPNINLNEKSLVVELASNDGYLLQYFHNRGIPVLGIEPAANVAAAAIKKHIPTIVEFFGVKLARELAAKDKKADLIVANNVLAHVPDINDFIAGIQAILKPTGIVTAEFPHLLRLLEGNQFDTIYHEHFSYFSLATIEKIFAHHGLTIFDVETLKTHGGSLRIYARHATNEERPITNAVRHLHDQEKAAALCTMAPYTAFAEKVRILKQRILLFFIEAHVQGKKIVGYGAPAKGNTLLNYCGIRSDLLPYTVDRNPYKQGRYLPGIHIPIHAPEKIQETKPDYLFILPWNLAPEITEQMAHIRSWGGKFVTPIPAVTILP